MNTSVVNRDGDMFIGTLRKEHHRNSGEHVHLKQTCLYLAHSPDFCKWATPMEVSVKFNSDVRDEVVQFELIWCLQGVWNE